MRSALVTGGSGFIGRHLVRLLLAEGMEVRTLGRARAPEFHRGATHAKLEAPWDVRTLACLLEANPPDYIFHLAGAARGSRAELEHVNIDLTRRLLTAIVDAGARPKLIVAGSAAEYGLAIRDGEPICESVDCRPSSDYGATKYTQTRLALDFSTSTGRPVVVARIFNPIGANMPRHLAIADFADQIASMPRSGGKLKVGNIDVWRDMMDVAHAATLLRRLAEAPEACGVVNVCAGHAQLLRELVDLLTACSGRKVVIEIDRERMRRAEPLMIVGSVDRLVGLVGPVSSTDFRTVIAGIWRSVERSSASQS